jgi:hypothetical protein
MSNEIRTLVTIITEASIEKTLAREIEGLGAKGYTISDARGKGARGSRSAEWDYDGNIRIEVVCSREVGDKLEAHLQGKYFDNFAMIIYSHDVNVLRSVKF